ncbi:MAG: CvpA family protein [Gallionella sp.]|nr:CvpA family protein [Gallionella sp.]MDD4947171.1 CvpA family protein [Gallionella sp.]MDD5612742.1 CvpA family protein [Gallionella sp.]
MTAFDYVTISIMLISLLLGVWRGFVYEVLSLAGWPLAFVLSKLYAAEIAPMLPVAQDEARSLAAYALVFIAALIVWGLLTWLVSRLVKAAGLGVLDSLLGGLFGILRGALVVLLMVWLAGLSSLPEQTSWREAKFSRAAEDVALLTKVWLPDNIAQRMHYRDRS